MSTEHRTWRELTGLAYEATAAATTAKRASLAADDAAERARADWVDERDEPSYQLTASRAAAIRAASDAAAQAASEAWALASVIYVDDAAEPKDTDP